jgi:hypothetical protein
MRRANSLVGRLLPPGYSNEIPEHKLEPVALAANRGLDGLSFSPDEGPVARRAFGGWHSNAPLERASTRGHILSTPLGDAASR